MASRLAALALVLLLAGCRSAAPNRLIANAVAGAAPAAAPTEPAAAATPDPAPPPAAGAAYVFGSAADDAGPLARAEIKVFAAGSSEPLSTATATADGRFAFDFPQGVRPGALLTVVATRDGRNLAGIVSAGAGNIVSAGAGNIIAAGGGNIVSAGAGNIVSAGAGNLVSAGAGNIVSAGAGNLRLLASQPGRTALTLGTSLAVAALGRRLRDALSLASSDDERAAVLGQVDKLAAEADKLLADPATTAALRDAVRGALDGTGVGSLPASAARTLVRLDADFAQAFRETAAAIGDVLVSLGKDDPPAADFGGISVKEGGGNGGGGRSEPGATPTPEAGVVGEAIAFGPALPATAPAGSDLALFDGTIRAGWQATGTRNVTFALPTGTGVGLDAEAVTTTCPQGGGWGLFDPRTLAAEPLGRYQGLGFSAQAVGADAEWQVQLRGVDGNLLALYAFTASAAGYEPQLLSLAALGLSPAAATSVREVRFVCLATGGGSLKLAEIFYWSGNAP